MGLKLVEAPQAEPVTLAEAKAHLRLDSINADDAYVTALVTAARQRVEAFLRRALITQKYELTLDAFPWNKYLLYTNSFFDIPRPPLQSVEWVKYVDTAGVLTTLPAEQYIVDNSSDEIARLALAWSQFWPITRYTINAVTVRFVAGYGDAPAKVPQAIRQGILIEISNLYEAREDVVVGQSVNMIPASERLLWPYRALAVE